MLKNSAITLAVYACMASVPIALAQDNATAQPAPSASASAATPVQQNLDEYITLLRKDVRSQKFAVVDAVMQLDQDEAAKFWPIYRDYDTELSKVNDLRLANIKDYAKTYNQLTDAKADELMRNGLAFQKQRTELLVKYYDRVKQSLGAVTAARFVQVENQLQSIIDLQIDSSLPIAGS